MVERSFKNFINNKTILITGGTGSFGKQVVNLLITLNPKKIIIFSRDENKQFHMRNSFNDPRLRFIIGDIRLYDSIFEAMKGVDYVFHASALKQVPTCEFFPMEAVHTNILGANNLAKAALENNVKKVVALSTDKAVYPINTMGMSKGIMEKIFIAYAKEQKETEKESTIFCVVRYGNVLYTRGSVIPYYLELMGNNKPLPVTNPQMTRFLLPLPQAVGLVLYTLEKGKSGNTYVRKSPACTMETLAKAVCELFNYTPGYIIVGVRAGEKMHETLINYEEIIRSNDIGDYVEIMPESQKLDYNQYYNGKKIVKKFGENSKLEMHEAYTSQNTTRLNIEQTKKLLLQIPEVQEELNLISYKK